MDNCEGKDNQIEKINTKRNKENKYKDFMWFSL